MIFHLKSKSLHFDHKRNNLLMNCQILRRTPVEDVARIHNALKKKRFATKHVYESA